MKSTTSSNVLLTGASGYVGGHVLGELLHRGHSVTALVREPERLGPFLHDPRVRVVQADLEEEARVSAALPGHDALVHAALIWGAEGTDLELRDTVAAARLFDAAGRAGLSRVVLISSAAVHRPFSALMSEEDALSPADLYGATTAAGELFLRAAAANYGFSGVVLRPGPVVGPPAFAGGAFRSDARISAMVQRAREGRPIEVTRGEGRQLLAAPAVAQAVCALITEERPFPTYLAMDPEITTWEQVARLVIDATGSPSELVLLDSDPHAPDQRFCVDRLERLLGAPLASREALQHHIAHLAGS